MCVDHWDGNDPVNGKDTCMECSSNDSPEFTSMEEEVDVDVVVTEDAYGLGDDAVFDQQADVDGTVEDVVEDNETVSATAVVP